MTDKSMDTNDEVTPDETELLPLKVEIMNTPKDKEPEDKTSWETQDEWDIINMSQEDIAEAEESRNA